MLFELEDEWINTVDLPSLTKQNKSRNDLTKPNIGKRDNQK